MSNRLKFLRWTACCLSWLCISSAFAGARPEVDLSVSVSISPASFTPGGRNTVTLTVHNAGPSAAGTIPGDTPSIAVLQDGFIITVRPPPFEVVPPISGCAIDRFVTEPLPDGNIALSFGYYFNAIPAGQSRTCVFDMAFDPSTVADLSSGFRVRSSNDEDVNPSNNRLDHLFVAAQSASIPTLSTASYFALIVGLLIGSTRRLRSSSCTQIAR